MSTSKGPERIQTVVIGAGQAGLSVGYFLKQQGLPFVILDANARIGDSWRNRWDSLRLFTPARYDGLAGMPFPAKKTTFPTKNEMADYLESYARRFELPVRSGVRVERVSRNGTGFLVATSHGEIEADQVVVAMANYQKGKVPAFASELDPHVRQLHSNDYRRPSQLREGPVLIVGAANSGAEIAMDLARTGVPGSRRIIVSGKNPGEVPFDIASFIGRHVMAPIVNRLVFHRLLTTDTPLGRKQAHTAHHRVAPLIRVKDKHLAAAGVERVGRAAGVRNGMPVLEDGSVVDVANVIWCTGFEPGFSWLDLPVFDEQGYPVHVRGVVTGEPGLYFVGLGFLYAMSSSMVHGVARDAEYVVQAVAARVRAAQVPSSRTSERSERVSGSTLPVPKRVTA